MQAAEESKLQEFTVDLQSESVKIARHMDREERDVISVYCMKNEVGKTLCLMLMVCEFRVDVKTQNLWACCHE